MPKGEPTPLANVLPGVPRGKVTRHKVETDSMAVGDERTVYLYQPPVKRPVPLVVVYDGPDYLRRAKLATIVDNLIAQKRIRPVALALVQNGGQARVIEYGCSELTLGFIAERVVGLAREHLNLVDINQKPGAYGIMGASMGGLMALYTGLRLPGMFGKVLSQSGAFSFPEHEFITSDLVRYLPKPKHRYLDGRRRAGRPAGLQPPDARAAEGEGLPRDLSRVSRRAQLHRLARRPVARAGGPLREMKLATLCYVKHEGRTLMVHRVKKADDIHQGKWNGLGGKLEPGESPEECVIREVREEFGAGDPLAALSRPAHLHQFQGG